MALMWVLISLAVILLGGAAHIVAVELVRLDGPLVWQPTKGEWVAAYVAASLALMAVSTFLGVAGYAIFAACVG